MSSRSLPLINLAVVRATIVDRCGRPLFGNRARVVSEGLASIAVTMNYDDGEEVVINNGANKRCAYKKPRATFINAGVDATFACVDPDLYTVLSGMPPIIDPLTGDTIGWDVDESIYPDDVFVSLDGWSESIGTIECDEDGNVPWGYFLWPLLSGGRVGDYSLEAGAVSFSVTGMTTNPGSLWAEGPYRVQGDDTGAAGFLQDPVLPTTHQRMFRTLVQPPAETPGLAPLDDPNSALATGATAGLPGTFTPANRRRPDDFAALVGGSVLASPTSAWTTGQRIILMDGSEAHWSGTAWQPGRA